MNYELSVTRSDLPDREREGLECYLIWQYRKEVGETTQCNLGRFHPCYRRSSNRKQGIRGSRLMEGEINRAGGPSYRPLQEIGDFMDRNWMGLDWSPAAALDDRGVGDIPLLPGVYKIVSPRDRELLYIGQSANLRSRLITHARKNWQSQDVCYSYHPLSKDILPHHLYEIENDLIGSFWGEHQKVPKYQFVNHA